MTTTPDTELVVRKAINRVADALEFKVPTPEQFARAWPNMRDRGYRI